MNPIVFDGSPNRTSYALGQPPSPGKPVLNGHADKSLRAQAVLTLLGRGGGVVKFVMGLVVFLWVQRFGGLSEPGVFGEGILPSSFLSFSIIAKGNQFAKAVQSIVNF